MTSIVYFYCEGTDIQYKKAWDAITDLENAGYNVIRELTTKADDYSYWEKLVKYWGKDDLIMIEQDNVVTVDQIKSLEGCPHAACCYWFYNSSKWLPGTLSIGCRLGDPEYNYMFNEGTIPMFGKEIKFCTFSGTGLTKISRGLQNIPIERFAQKTRANGLVGLNTDNAIVQNINSTREGFIKFHIHGEVKHSST